MAKTSNKKILPKTGTRPTKAGATVDAGTCLCDVCDGVAGGGVISCEDGVPTYIPPPTTPGLWVLVFSSNGALPYWITVQQLVAQAGNQAMPAQSVMRKSSPRKGKR